MDLETEQGNDVAGDSSEPTTTADAPETTTENAAEQPAGVPQYVTTEQFAALNKTIEGFGTTLQTVQRALHSQPAAAPQAPAAQQDDPDYEPTEEELTEAFTSAKLKPTLAKFIESEVRKRTRGIERELNEVRSTGTHAIASLTAQAARPSMPYYDRFQGEIEEYVKTLDGSARMNPHAYRLAHDAVVGRHAADLISEAKREAVRSARANDVALPGGGRGPAGKPGAPLPEGTEAEALEALGMTPDEFARKQGYDSWEDRHRNLAKYMRAPAKVARR